jgi:hypothetical protein
MKDGKRDYDAILAMWESDFPDPAGNLTSQYSSANEDAPYVLVNYPKKTWSPTSGSPASISTRPGSGTST